MAQAKKKAPIELKDKEYRLCNNLSPLSWIIKTGGRGNLLVFDEKERVNRPIRHCRNEKSIFIDEQSEHALLEPIIIEKGYLLVKATETATQAFLDIHPDNAANGGNIFEEIDEDKEAEEALEREDMIIDLKSEVRAVQAKEDGIFKLQSLVAVLKNSVTVASKMTSSELRREIYLAIENNPKRFMDGKKTNLFSEEVSRRHIALLGLASDVIKTSADGRRIVWSENGETITNIPMGIKATDHLFAFLESDEGLLVLDELQKRI